VGEAGHCLPIAEAVHNLVAFKQVSALEQYRLCTQLAQLFQCSVSAGCIADRLAQQEFCLGMFGVISVASGISRSRNALNALSSSRRAPLVAIMTGSSTTNAGRYVSSASATAWMTSALASMPSLTAPTVKSSKQASICARRKPTGGTCTALTPRVFCAVRAAMAESPCTRWAANALRSAWMPAPPPESEPAMVSAE
jgi:hypothetical protein